MPCDLTQFGLAEMLRCGNGLRSVTKDACTMEAAAREACRYLHRELVASDGSGACVLVRCYKTHRFGDLPPELQAVARRALRGRSRPAPDLRCLTLIGTAGDEPAWNDRRRSVGHRVIPLASKRLVEQAPMIAELLHSFGVDVSEIVEPSKVVRDRQGKTYGVFHVEEALSSPHIPAQDFVRQHAVQSVVGCGGSLLHGDLFALILFARVHVTAASAERFRSIALDLKSRFFLYGSTSVFDETPPAPPNEGDHPSRRSEQLQRGNDANHIDP